MTPSDEHLIQQHVATLDLIKAMVALMLLHEDADSVEVNASLKDGRLEHAHVSYQLKGKTLGGFGL